jgi:hypothetical protein
VASPHTHRKGGGGGVKREGRIRAGERTKTEAKRLELGRIREDMIKRTVNEIFSFRSIYCRIEKRI